MSTSRMLKIIYRKQNLLLQLVKFKLVKHSSDYYVNENWKKKKLSVPLISLNPFNVLKLSLFPRMDVLF